MSLKFLSKSMIALIANMILFLFIASNYNGEFLQSIDAYAIGLVHSLPNSFLVAGFTVLSNFASFYGIAIMSTIIILRYRRKDYAIYNMFIALVAYMLSHNLKNHFLRLRPDLMQLVTETGFSFPSAHALVGTAFYGFIMLYVRYNSKSKPVKFCTYLFCSLIIFGIAASRLYLRVHYLTDVVAGIALGGALVSVFAIIRNLAFGVNLRSRFSAEINEMFEADFHEEKN